MIPTNLQGILWSVNIAKLDLKRDKNYIINQVLAYGTWDHLKWLFSVYSKEEIKDVFVHNPAKDFVPASYNFVKNCLLKIPENLDPANYVRSLPRNIRQ